MNKKKLKKKLKDLERRVSFIEENYKRKNPNETMNFIPFSTSSLPNIINEMGRSKNECDNNRSRED